jgi:hypothetical protein
MNFLLTLPEHLNFGEVRVAQLVVFCVVFSRSLFVLLYFFLLAIMLSVLLQFTASDYPFGIFNVFDSLFLGIDNKTVDIACRH